VAGYPAQTSLFGVALPQLPPAAAGGPLAAAVKEGLTARASVMPGLAGEASA